MGRRRRKDDQPESTAWSSYPPTDARYWFYGGQWVPPDQIPPQSGLTAEMVRPYEKPMTRLKSVTKLLEELESKLGEVIVYYTDLHRRGVEALKWDWEREKIAQGDFDSNQPNGYHQALRWSYRDIAYARAMIPLYEAIIDGLTPGQMPLFARRKPS